MNQELVRANEEPELLDQVCQAIVREGRYLRAWIGYGGQDEDKTLRRVAKAGFDDANVETPPETWASTEVGQDPAGEAMRTGKPSVRRGIRTGRDPASRRGASARRDRRSAIALPLRAEEETFGVLCIDAAEPDAFGGERSKLLVELANSLAHGISVRRAVAARERAEELLNAQRDLSLAVSASRTLKDGLKLCLDAALRTSGMDCGGIYLADTTTGALDLAIQKGLPPAFVSSASHYDANSPSARLVAAAKPIYSEHLQLGIEIDQAHSGEGLFAVAVLPLRHDDRVVGSLNVASHTLRAVPSGSRIALETIAAQIGGAIARLRTEQALRISEERYRVMVESAGESIVVAQDGVLKYANPRSTEYTGFAVEELTARPFDRLVHPDDRELVVARHLARLRGGGDPEVYPFRLVTKEGTTKWVQVSAIPITWDGRPATLNFLYDITEGKRAEEALRESEARYRLLAENANDIIFTMDLGLRFTYVSPSVTRMRGYSVEEAMAQTVAQVLAPSSLEGAMKALQEELERDADSSNRSRSRTLELEEYCRDGRTVWTETTFTLLHDAHGGTTGLLGITRDISERKRAEEELRRRAAEFAALYDTARDLATQQGLPTLLETILERATVLLGTSCGSVFLYEGKRRHLQVVASKGLQHPSGSLQLGEGMAGRVALTQQPLFVNDYGTWEGRSPQYEGIPFGAALQVPMLYGGELIGVLDVSETSAVARQFTDADMRLLSLFAAQAASAVHNARLLEETHSRAGQLALLYDAGLTLNRVLDPREQLEVLSRTAMQAVHADHAGFFRFDAAQGELRYELGIGKGVNLEGLGNMRFPLGEEHGLVGWIAKNRTPFYLPEVSADPRWVVIDPEIRSALWVPIERERELLGILSVTSTRVNPFAPQDERLLSLFANQIAVAMENARLFGETRRRLAELQAVNKISTALRTAQTLEAMLPLLLDETLSILSTEAGVLSLFDSERGRLYGTVTRGWMALLPPDPVRPGEGIVGHVFATGEPYLTREFATDPRTHESKRGFVPSGWGAAGIPIRAAREIIGVLIIAVPLPRELTPDELRLLSTIAEIAGNAIHRTRLHEQTQRDAAELARAYDTTLGGWARALELRDQETEGHTRRVVEMTLDLAQAMGMNDEEMENTRRGALLHDIGKMGIPDSVLLKPGTLNDREWEIMKRHPEYARELLEPIDYLRPAVDIPYSHHEKWDGTGYPRGLSGESIPLAARIFAVVDVWDALTSDRVYRRAWTEQKALEYIRAQSGKHFDPNVVELFLRRRPSTD